MPLGINWDIVLLMEVIYHRGEGLNVKPVSSDSLERINDFNTSWLVKDVTKYGRNEYKSMEYFEAITVFGSIALWVTSFK